MAANSPNTALRLLKPVFLALIGTLLCSSAMAAQSAPPQTTQTQTNTRKAKLNPPPEYPELARKMNIQGMARVLAKVAADGEVVGVKELGGNPVLVSALANAVKKWKYEPAEHESEIEIKFEFVQTH
ncbi:MAG: energy transducer TonB [Candidatus Angelobacter sp.]